MLCSLDSQEKRQTLNSKNIRFRINTGLCVAIKNYTVFNRDTYHHYGAYIKRNALILIS
jgi:hypothetical protein